MRTIGQRTVRQIGLVASGELLVQGARFNHEIHRLPTGCTTFNSKGVYRFITHAQANQHQLDCLVRGMAQVAQEQKNEQNTPFTKTAAAHKKGDAS